MTPDAQPSPEAEVRSAQEFEDWFVETFHNVPGLTTELYNRFRAAADEFKARLRVKEP